MFERAERGTNITPSVTLLYQCKGVSPFRHTVELFGRPLRNDVPTPHNAIIKKWSLGIGIYVIESDVADFFQFENTKLAKKLEVFEWTLEERFGAHYAFMFKVVDM